MALGSSERKITGNEPTSKDQREIERELSKLTNNLEILRSRCECLSVKLEPIKTTLGIKKDEEKCKPSCACRLGQELSDLADYTGTLTNFINYNIEALEL